MFDHEGPVVISVIRDLGVFENLEIISPMDSDKRLTISKQHSFITLV